jgi:predicted GH43/DUF377 family glycosyl hydrolase
MAVDRFPENPLLVPEDVPPSADGLEVVGVFNPGAFVFDGRVGLLVRVAERPVQGDPETVAVPVFGGEGDPPGIEVITLRRDDPGWDFSDPRVVIPRPGSEAEHVFLTSVSHLRLAWSEDGRRFELGESLWPSGAAERLGIEDARVTRVEETYWIAYSAIGAEGIAVGVMTTSEFRSFERRGLVLPPENKDAALFPDRIGGRYGALHRPSGTWGRPGMWFGWSADGVHWGEHSFVAGPRPGGWDSLRIGAGPPPIRTDRGWLEIYHGAGPGGYGLGAMLLALDDPSRVLARSAEPLMVPEAEYERSGFYGNVVFCNGLVERPQGEVWLYYGGADRVTAGCRCRVEEILDTLV